MKNKIILMLASLALPSILLASPGKIKIVTTMTVLKKLSEQMGGNLVIVNSLTGPNEDPHAISERPTFKSLVREADLFIKIGRSLELWSDRVLSSSQNPKLIVVIASHGVISLEVPSELSRSKGDIHPEGNPHVWLSPVAAIKMAENIRDALIKFSPANRAIFDKNFADFKQKLSENFFGPEMLKAAGNSDFLWRMQQGGNLSKYLQSKKMLPGGWLKKAASIDYPFFTYHNALSYLAKDFSLKVLGQIEEKPGIPPTLKHQQDLKALAKAQNVHHVVAESYYTGNKKLIDKLAHDIGGKSLMLMVDCKENESYFDFIERILSELVQFRGRG